MMTFGVQQTMNASTMMTVILSVLALARLKWLLRKSTLLALLQLPLWLQALLPSDLIAKPVSLSLLLLFKIRNLDLDPRTMSLATRLLLLRSPLAVSDVEALLLSADVEAAAAAVSSPMLPDCFTIAPRIRE